MVIKCKMCGGDLEVQEGRSVCECEYCGSTQTMPSSDNEKKMNLFNRANRYRMNSEFDKASAIYASIAAEFPQEAEAYWGLCLCKFGIEYIDDPLTGNKIPTCHRTLTTSILDDSDYLQTRQNADAVARSVYEEEAKRIDVIQQDILRIVKSETPYDVFICYKETDENGDRTEDSVIAHEIYDSLSEKGLKVFFARITLEDKLGQQYEPYIFAALQSARVMIVVGTSYENLDAVWVKNEWSRFLDMMKNDRAKNLIPCYKGLEIDELPKAFQRLQAQDLSKLGWKQDLTRGVEKICGKTQQTAETRTINEEKEKTIDYLDRASVYLEDGLWEKAVFYADQELTHHPKKSKAYQIKLLAEMRIKKLEDLRKKDTLIFRNQNFVMALKYADGKEREELDSIDQESTYKARHKCSERLTILTDKTVNAVSMDEFRTIEEEIDGMYDFPEVEEFRKVFSQAKERLKETLYSKAQRLMLDGQFDEAFRTLEQINGYKDTKELQAKCKVQIKKQKAYDEACELKKLGYLEAAAAAFRNLSDYRDSEKLAKECGRKSKVRSIGRHIGTAARKAPTLENNIAGAMAADKSDKQRRTVQKNGQHMNQLEKTTGLHKVATVLHMVAVSFLMLLCASIANGSGNSSVGSLLLIGVFLTPILAWLLDKQKKTKQIFLNLLILFCALIAGILAANGDAKNPISMVIIGIGAALTILF